MDKPQATNKVDVLPVLTGEQDSGEQKIKLYSHCRDFLRECSRDTDAALRLLTEHPEILQYRYQPPGFLDNGKPVTIAPQHPLREAITDMTRRGSLDPAFVLKLLDHPATKALDADTQRDLLNSKGRDGYTLLGKAVLHHQPELAADLIRRGALVTDLNPKGQNLLVMIAGNAKSYREMEAYARVLPALQKQSSEQGKALAALAEDYPTQYKLLNPRVLVTTDSYNLPAVIDLTLKLSPAAEKQIDTWMKAQIGEYADLQYMLRSSVEVEDPAGTYRQKNNFTNKRDLKIESAEDYEHGRIEWITKACTRGIALDKMMCDEGGKLKRGYNSALPELLAQVAPHLRAEDMKRPEVKALLNLMPKYLPMTADEAKSPASLSVSDSYRAVALMSAMKAAAENGNAELIRELAKYKHYVSEFKLSRDLHLDMRMAFERDHDDAVRHAIVHHQDTKVLEALLDAGVQSKYAHRYIPEMRNPDLADSMLKTLKEKGVKLEILKTLDGVRRRDEDYTENHPAWRAVEAENARVIPALIKHGIMPEGMFKVKGVDKTLLAHTIDYYQKKQGGQDFTPEQQAVINQIVAWEQQKAKDAEKKKTAPTPATGEKVGLVQPPSLPRDIPGPSHTVAF